MKTLILIVFALSLISCAANPIPIVDVKYKMDMEIINKEFSFTGMGVLPVKPLYTISFQSPGKLDLFTFRTCSREVAIENARHGLDTKEAIINYAPNEIEKQPACPADIGGFAENGRHSWGYIDFEDTETILPAINICGEITTNTGGVSVCQQREGLIQKIKFDVKVMIKPDLGCTEIKSESGTFIGKEFEYRLGIGLCVYAFVEIGLAHRVHRHTAYGYQDILIRK